MIGAVSRTRTALAALLLSTAGLAGCAEDDPDPAPPAPSSEAPAPSSATPTAMGPVETVRAWVEAQNEAMSDGDSSRVRSLSTADCRSCDGLIRPIEEVMEAGGRFETAGWSVDHAKQTSHDERRAVIKAAITIAAGKTYPSEGTEPVAYEADGVIVEFKLDAVDGQWLVSFIGFVA